MFDVVPKSLHVNPPKAWPGRGFVVPTGKGFLPLLSLLPVLPLLPLLAGALLLGGACTVGQGVGRADGVIFVEGCNGNQPYGGSGDAGVSPMGTPVLQPFSLNPTFFAGDPIDDVSSANPANRLVIRMQREGTRIEVNDILFVDVRNVQQVGRCVRGLDPISGLPDKSNKQGWCDWTRARCCAPGDATCLAIASPCVEVSPDFPISASLQLLFSCRGVNLIPPSVIGEAVSDPVAPGAVPDGGAGDGGVTDAGTGDGGAPGAPGAGSVRYSWIDFADFGKVKPDTVSVGPIGNDFKVDFGERLRATFHVVLDDQRVNTAIRDMDVLIPVSAIGGVLDGSFDFDLERGRAAQPFP